MTIHPKRITRRLLFSAFAVVTLTFCYLYASFFPREEGVRTLTVPELRGSVWKEGAAGADFSVELRQIPDDASPGTVLSTDPPGASRRKAAAGERYPLTVVVSGGKERFPLPDLRGKSGAEATRALHALGLSVRRIEWDAGAEKAGYVLALSPAPGAPLSPGDTVTLYVGKYDFSL